MGRYSTDFGPASAQPSMPVPSPSAASLVPLFSQLPSLPPSDDASLPGITIPVAHTAGRYQHLSAVACSHSPEYHMPCMHHALALAPPPRFAFLPRNAIVTLRSSSHMEGENGRYLVDYDLRNSFPKCLRFHTMVTRCSPGWGAKTSCALAAQVRQRWRGRWEATLRF